MARKRNVQQTKPVTITKTQQVELNKTVIHTVVSQVVWQRNLLPRSAFKSQHYDTANIPNHDDVAFGRLPEHSSRKAQRHVVPIFSLCAAKKSERVQWHTETLKIVLEAFVRGDLRAVQYQIHPSATALHEILEIHTINFQYDGSGDLPLTSFSSQHTTGPKRATASMLASDASTALSTIVDEVGMHCSTFPLLPRETGISTHLFFKEGIEILPKNFVAHSTEQQHFISYPGWKRVSNIIRGPSLGCMRSAFVSTILEPPDVNPAGHAQISIPADAEFDAPVSMFDYVGILDRPASPRPNTQPVSCIVDLEEAQDGDAETVVSQAEPDNLDEADLAGSCEADIDDHGVSQASRRIIQTQSTLTASNAVNLARKQDVDRMIREEPITQGDTQAHHPVSTKGFHLVLDHKSAEQLADTERARVNRRKADEAGHDTKARKHSRGCYILCVCGCHAFVDEINMFKCTFCYTWHHIFCYGFHGSNDRRYPKTQACYRCLLVSPDATEILPTVPAQLACLALQRHLIMLARDGKARTSERFVADLRGDPGRIHDALKDLLKRGFLQTTSGTRARITRSGKDADEYVEATDSATLETVENELFEPVLHVDAHYFYREIIPKTPLVQRVRQPSVLQPAQARIRELQRPNETPSRKRVRDGEETPRSAKRLYTSMYTQHAIRGSDQSSPFPEYSRGGQL